MTMWEKKMVDLERAGVSLERKKKRGGRKTTFTTNCRREGRMRNRPWQREKKKNRSVIFKPKKGRKRGASQSGFEKGRRRS